MVDETGIFLGAASGAPQHLVLQSRQPPRPDRGRDRHRQDRHPAGPRRRLFARRRAGVRRRREGRPRRAGDGRIADRQGARRADRARRRDRPDRLRLWRQSGHLLGSLRRAGPPDPHHRFGDGAAAAGAADGAQRDAGRRAQHRLPRRRRAGAAAAQPRGPAGVAGPLRRECGQPFGAPTAMSPSRASGSIQRAIAPARKPGRRPLLRRARARHRRFPPHRRKWPRHDQHPRRRQADDQPEALRDLPAVAAVRTVRGASRGRRSGQAQARLLLRRGASAVRRRAAGAAGQDRAGRAADPVEGGRRLFRHPEPDRHSRGGRGPARQPHPARAARLHAQGPARDQGRGRDLPHQSQARRRDRDHRAQGRRGAGLGAAGRWRADAGRAHTDRAAAFAARAADRQGARDHALDLAGRGQI